MDCSQTIEGVGTCTATAIVSGKQHATFEFEEDSPGKRTAISKFALLTDISLEPSVTIESSYFGNNRARGTLIKTSNVVVKDSVYNSTSDHCILAFPDGCYWSDLCSVSSVLFFKKKTRLSLHLTRFWVGTHMNVSPVRDRFESNGFSNWSILNNTLIGCGAESTQADIFVAACAPIYNNGLPTQNGNPITSGQPFANGRVIGTCCIN